ncbi:hypothetical protein [Hydrocoleum sp. CS-953]|nr:hypothetical protein [Hydrocoleum sp. CS-953]
MERFDGGKLTIYRAPENENISGIAPRACHQLRRLTKWVFYVLGRWRSLC